jgi:hypothetical protein
MVDITYRYDTYVKPDTTLDMIQSYVDERYLSGLDYHLE